MAQSYEYMHRRVETLWASRQSTDEVNDALVNVLNEMDAAGWEPFQVFMGAGGNWVHIVARRRV